MKPTFTNHELLQRRAAGIQLAFFDIDGTLLGLDGNYTRRVRDSILSCREAGIKTAVASGRPKFAADFLINELQLQDAGLFYTGALVFDPQTNTSLELHPLADRDALNVVLQARKLKLYTEVCTRDHFYVDDLLPVGREHSVHLRAVPTECSLDTVIGREPIIKLLLASTDAEQQHRLLQLEQEFPALEFAYARMAAKPDWLFASVISPQACKQQGFDQLMSYHQLQPEQVVAFGDAQSDKVFLSRAGLGVAMGNAAEDVQAVADIVTLPVWEDGVAEVLDAIVAQK